MPTAIGDDELTAARATLHELMNALAAARVWLAVVSDAAAEQPALADSIGRIGRSIDNADQCSKRLREILPSIGRPATPPATSEPPKDR